MWRVSTCLSVGTGPSAFPACVGRWAAWGASGLSCLCLPGQAVESVQAEDESAQLCKRRIEHLKEHSSDQPAAAGLWKRKRMDRMMAEHLLRCGYYNTAVKLARQSGIEVRAAAGVGGGRGTTAVLESGPGQGAGRSATGPPPRGPGVYRGVLSGQARVQRSESGRVPVREPRCPRPGCAARPGGRQPLQEGCCAPRGRPARRGGVP